MHLIKIADRLIGRTLRFLFNTVTGNYFIHSERRVLAAIAKLEASIDIAFEPLRQQHDAQQRELLKRYQSDD
jgi:hypothetical protein